MRVIVSCVLCLALAALAAGCGESSDLTRKPDRPDPAAARNDLRLGSDPWPPFTDSTGRPRVAIQVVHTALERSGVKAVSLIHQDFAEVTRRIQSGELDGSAAIWRSGEREGYLLYSRPYFENRIVLIGRKGSDVSATDLKTLTGRKVGIVAGYAYGPAILEARGPDLVEGRSVKENLLRLKEGMLDYVLADQFLAYHIARDAGSGGRYEIGRTAFARRTLHFAIRRNHPKAAAILAGFNTAVTAMMEDGTFNRILQVDWIEVDVDGDGKRELVLAGKQAGTTPPKQSYRLFGDGSDAAAGARYRIDGKTYERWDEVPKGYQTEMERQEPGVKLLEFDF